MVWCRLLVIDWNLLQAHELLYLVFIGGLATLDNSSNRPDGILIQLGILEKRRKQ